MWLSVKQDSLRILLAIQIQSSTVTATATAVGVPLRVMLMNICLTVDGVDLSSSGLELIHIYTYKT